MGDALYYMTFGLVGGAVVKALVEALQPPDPEPQRTTTKQEHPPRNYAGGRVRVSGPFMLREAESEQSQLHLVLALPEGPVASYGRRWLHDDQVTVISNVVQQRDDGAYETGRVRFYTRLGLDTETRYPIDWTAVWPTNARGDGIPSLYLRCRNGKLEDVPRQFPNHIPEPSVEGFYAAYDWRLDSTAGGAGSHRRDDKTTWTHSRNPVVWAVNILWRRFGADWDRRFAPVLDILTAEADYCDELVPLKGGGSEPRYEWGDTWDSTTTAAQFWKSIEESMDGWFGKRRDGAYIIRAGRVDEPTVIFGDREIIDYEFDPGPTPDEAINVLAVSFTDPQQAYTKVEVDQWREVADIDLRGEEKVAPFYPRSVQSRRQVRALAKRKAVKGLAPRGTFRTPLSARRGLGQRYVGLNISDCDDLMGVWVEVKEVEIDLPAQSLVWTYVLVDGSLDDWDPDMEEGDGGVVPERPPAEPLPLPTIDTITPFFESAGGGIGVRLHIDGEGPDRDDLTWFYSWRVSGSTSWGIFEITDEDPAVNFEGDTGFVSANAVLDVRLGYQTGAGTMVWSEIEEGVNTSLDAVAPAAPTDLSGSSPAAGEVELEWRNPTSFNFDHARVFRGGAADAFGDAADITGAIPGAAGAIFTLSDTGLSAGTYRYWVVAENLAGAASTPVGPEEVVVA